MSSTDWILSAILAASMLLGVWRGLVYEVLSVIGWIAAFVLAQWFAPTVAAQLPMESSGDTLRYAAAFVLVFVASVFAAGLISALMKKVISAVGLRPVDRMLGAIFGLFRGVILLLAVSVVVHMTALQESEWWLESKGAPMLITLLKGLRRHKVLGGIAHAFNGSLQQAQVFVELGFALGFGGAMTYERALQLRQLARALPLEAIVLETDAPDIPPHWLYRTQSQRQSEGLPQGRNEPSQLPQIGAVLAQLRGASIEHVATATLQNTLRVLPRLQSISSLSPH